MAILFLLIAFCSALYGGWVFVDGYFTATVEGEKWVSAVSGIAFAVIPYMVAKCLSEMVAIRQRHLSMEQLFQQNHLLNQQLQSMQKPPAPRKNPPAAEPPSEV